MTPSLASTSPRASFDKDSTREGHVVSENTGADISSDVTTSAAEVSVPDTRVPAVDVHSSTLDVDLEEPTNVESEPVDHMSNDAVKTSRCSDLELAESNNNQDIINWYVEEIESLRAKLQFLTQQVISMTREKANQADNGSLHRELAEKDGKIALLLEEGSKLSQNEMKLMNIIKSLRSKSTEDHKQMANVKQIKEQMDKSIKNLQERLRIVEAAGKDDLKQSATLEKMEKDLENARNDAQAKAKEVSELQEQLTRNAVEGQKAEVIRKVLEAEKNTNRDLQEEVSNAKIERSLLEDRQKAQIRALESKFDREAQNSKSTELDLRREIQILESRLETYKARAEENSTDAKADVQAKLVRQIETLQNSYSVASENWRGIESSLMARIAAFEKDQVEAQKKEAELRRKLREATSKNKEMESTLEIYRSQIGDLEEKLSSEIEKHKQTTSNLTKTETELMVTQEDFKSTKGIMESRLEKLESEKQSAIQESLSFRPRAQSPQVRGGFEPSTSSSRRHPQSLGLSIPNAPGPSDRTHSRRASAQPSPGYLPPRQDSAVSIPQSTRNSIPPTPVINEIGYDDDDFFANTPATPPERTVHDMVSTSTAGAGPSVQLVERITATVRRLESEKQASKDELERLSVQRDEARNQVVELMQELRGKKQDETKIASLEQEILGLNEKLQTTLEMLGEKSEQVEELQQDITDMKEIYRATLESTVK